MNGVSGGGVATATSVSASCEWEVVLVSKYVLSQISTKLEHYGTCSV